MLTGFTVCSCIASYTGTVVGIDLVQTCSTILTRAADTFIYIYKRREDIVNHRCLCFLTDMPMCELSALSGIYSRGVIKSHASMLVFSSNLFSFTLYLIFL